MLSFTKCSISPNIIIHNILHFRWWLCLCWCTRCWGVSLFSCTLLSLAAMSLGPTPLPSSTVSTSKLPRILQGIEMLPLLVCSNCSKVSSCGIKLFLVPREDLYFSVLAFLPEWCSFSLTLFLSLSVSHIHLQRAVLSKRKLTVASEVNATVTSSQFSIHSTAFCFQDPF